jgi:hypothetical protein
MTSLGDRVEPFIFGLKVLFLGLKIATPYPDHDGPASID